MKRREFLKVSAAGAAATAVAAPAIAPSAPEITWRLTVVVIGVTCSVVAWRRNALPAVFAAAFVVSAVRLAFVNTGTLSITIEDATWAQAATDLVAGPTLIAVTLLAIRARRGRLGLRELLDASTVTAAAGLAAWITIANPAWNDGLGLGLALAAAAYVPIAFMLLTFTLELQLEGLGRNRAMWLAMASSAGNFVATIVRGLVHTDGVSGGASQVVAGVFTA